jgi:AraC-like DNA-binding protein
MPAPRALHSVRRLTLPAQWSIQSHAHDGFHEIVAVVAGTIETRIAGRVQVDGPGTVKLQPRGVAHAERCLGGQALELLVLCWDPGRRERCLGWPGSVQDEGGRIGHLLAWMVQPGISARFKALLAETAAAAYQQAALGVEAAIVASTRSYILAHLGDTIGLDALAANVHLSRFHFARRFRAASGRSPMQLVAALRVEAARDLLLTSDLPLRTIATRVGFSDETSLSHAIREHTGLPPGALRRQA